MIRQVSVASLVLAVFAAFMTPVHAKIIPNGLFKDHSVLQQKAPVPVWGTADPNEPVTVSINVQSASTVADAAGKWMVKLKPLAAGGPYSMTITGAQGDTVAFSDVLVGEVWLCSGQSNMAFVLNRDVNADAAKAGAKDPLLHFAVVAATAATSPQTDVHVAWSQATPDTVGQLSAVSYYFARELRKDLNVPVGVIVSAWGGTVAEAWTDRATLEADPGLKYLADAEPKALTDYAGAIKNYNDRLPDMKAKFDAENELYTADKAKWDIDATAAKAAGATVPPAPKPPVAPMAPQDPATRPNYASHLFNGMINPLVPYAIRGAIWYQGESNATRAAEYANLFPKMISDWRSVWGEGQFPFLFVQLAPFGAITTTPTTANWAELREAQRLTLQKLPNTGMAVGTDVGDAKNIHPTRKEPVGARLALAARAIAYGEKIEDMGPVFAGAKVEGSTMRVTFAHADGLHPSQVNDVKTDGALVASTDKAVQFEVAGADRVYHNADAKIDGASVIVSSPDVPSPVTVRYGWAAYPIANLTNSSGLPASPFTTDTRPWITEPKAMPVSGK